MGEKSEGDSCKPANKRSFDARRIKRMTFAESNKGNEAGKRKGKPGAILDREGLQPQSRFKVESRKCAEARERESGSRQELLPERELQTKIYESLRRIYCFDRPTENQFTEIAGKIEFARSGRPNIWETFPDVK